MALNSRVSPLTRRDFLKQTTLALSAAVLLPDLKAEDAKSVIAETAFGKVRGIDNNGIKIFKGIPYGANTSGMNRFMPPGEPAKWAGVRDALQYGHSAPQSDPAARPLSAEALTISGRLLRER
jgi:Carboxylesterase family